MHSTLAGRRAPARSTTAEVTVPDTTAERIAAVATSVLGGPLPVRIRAWDGSETGPAGAPVLVVTRRGLRRLMWSPGELGLAEGYLTGDLDVEGDLAQGLAAIWTAVRGGTLRRRRLHVTDYPRLAVAALRLGAIGPRPARPGAQARLRGAKHTPERDRAAIAHHYDLSNEFYELLLGPTMAYSCAYFTGGPDQPVDDAQRAKLDLICRKLGLGPGRRLLDIGCGWGSLVRHAAEHYGADVVGVTLSRAQHEYVSKRVADDGLTERVTVRLADYRELIGSPTDRAGFDAVSSIEMGEHVGDGEYPVFARILHDVLRPGGRALVQQMSRPRAHTGGGPFIETYIAPDMHMKPVGTTISLLATAGLEIRDVHALREHYGWTAQGWLRTLEDRWIDVVAMIGEEGARVWRLYLIGGGLAFAQNRMGVDQILAVRPDDSGASGMQPTRRGWDVS
jgi:cyclopropane-fatty-acyl-phospholipid synthase